MLFKPASKYINYESLWTNVTQLRMKIITKKRTNSVGNLAVKFLFSINRGNICLPEQLYFSQYGLSYTRRLTYAVEIRLITICSSYWKYISMLFVSIRYIRLRKRLSVMVIILRISYFRVRYTNMELMLQCYTSSKQA